MRVVATIVLLLLFSVQTFSKWMWVLDYQLNKTYVAQNLCINKAKPMLHCNGQCQLTKKLAEEDNKTSNSTAAKHYEETFFFKPEIQMLTYDRSLLPSGWNIGYVLKAYTAPRTTPFRPPAA